MTSTGENARYDALVPLFLATVVLLFPRLAVSQHSRDATGFASKRLEAAHRRVLSDGMVFAPGAFMPHWENGYLVSKVDVDIYRPNMPTVRLYDATGAKVKEVALWFDGPERIYLRSTAVSTRGEIVVSGVAVTKGIRAPFIARFDGTGRVSDVIQTASFHASNICIAADRTVWSFGTAGRDAPEEPTLRQFEFQRGQVAAYLPRSTFQTEDPRRSPASNWNEQEVMMRCTPDRVVIYTDTGEEYIEADPATGAIERFKLDPSTKIAPIHGSIAVTPSGDLFTILRKRNPTADTAWGLFQLDVNRSARTARWLPVEGHMRLGFAPGAVTLVLGADQDGVVYTTIGDPHALHWARPRDRN